MWVHYRKTINFKITVNQRKDLEGHYINIEDLYLDFGLRLGWDLRI